MDFGSLLHIARKNSEEKKNTENKFYSTKFSAPKKITKEKKLSDNIKRFLAKKEQEEKEQSRLKQQKVAQLLAMRDEKSKNKIRKMLKVTKSANKSVLDDAVDNENTAITLQGPEQPDEDDYGYVSQEAAAFYQKYMDKVKALPEENKFAPSRSSIKADLSGTKDRVKEAIRKEQEEKNNPLRIKSSSSEISKTSTSSSSSLSLTSRKRKDLYDPEAEREREKEEEKRREEERKKTKVKKAAPPPMDFKELLRIAEKKQYEPVAIEVEVEKEPERLLTKKQKKELEERKAYLDEREKRKSGGGTSTANNKVQQPLNGKIPKLNGAASLNSTNDSRKSATLLPNEKTSTKPSSSSQLSKVSLAIAASPVTKNEFKKPVTGSSIKSVPKSVINSKPNNHASEAIKTTTKHISAGINNNLSSTNNSKMNSKLTNSQASSSRPNTSFSMKSNISNTKSTSALTTQQQKATINASASRQTLQKSSSSNSTKHTLQQNSKEIRTKSNASNAPMERERTRQFPPPDIRSNSSRSMKKPPLKRRIVDDDDEYDSELDDFIDDGPEEGENYSTYIREIFGYDKSRYRDVDDDDLDMESSFVQQMKEEQLSKKIGLMEDLEDMRLEAQEKKKKALMKKTKLK